MIKVYPLRWQHQRFHTERDRDFSQATKQINKQTSTRVSLAVGGGGYYPEPLTQNF